MQLQQQAHVFECSVRPLVALPTVTDVKALPAARAGVERLCSDLGLSPEDRKVSGKAMKHYIVFAMTQQSTRGVRAGSFPQNVIAENRA